MPDTSRKRYAIHFDLKIARLKEVYSSEHPKQAYSEIAKFMKAHGFSHRQWSGYVSGQTMTRKELAEFTLALHRQFPWLLACENRMDATVVSGIFDLHQMMLDSMEDEESDIEID